MFIHVAQLGGAFIDQRRELFADSRLLVCAFAITMAAIEHNADQCRQRALREQGA
ncbi:hypothetical protein D3C72_2327010 [compost metagenome]